jgi:hypothetical protein
MLTTLRSVRIAILLLLFGAVWLPGASADHGTPGQSFTFLQAPFTQELFGTHADFVNGIAFAPDGDVLIAFGRLARYDRQGVEPNTHGDGLHPLTQLQFGFSLGIANHPDGTLYANNGSGVSNYNADTGALLRGPFGLGGNGLGIAIDPKTNNIVYPDRLGTVSFVDPSFSTSGVFSNVTGFYDGIFFDPTGDFLFLADFSIPGVTILRHDGSLVQHIQFTGNCCPDGIVFKASPPRFVVTNNTDGTMTRLDFPGEDFTQPPTQTLFASGGFRGDLANVGPDRCLYLSQGGTRFQDGQTSSEGSIVRICPGFAPPPPNGKLEVKKSLSPSSDPGRFNLLIDGSTEKANAGDGDTTGEIVVSTGIRAVGETGGTNPPTSLNNYTSSIVCKDQDGHGAIVAQSSDAGPLNVTVNQNDDIVCTITNTAFKATTTTYTGDPSVQYSDGVALSGRLLDTSVTPNVGVAGKQLDFTLGTQTASASPTDASGNASTSLVVTQKPGSVTTVATVFAGDATFAGSSDSDDFSILKEDCTLIYSGDTLVSPATMTNLTADMGEPDASPGDRSDKTVTFAVTDAAMNTQTFTATTDAGGHASTTVALPAGVYGVSVSFAGDDFYLPCATVMDTLVTVQAAAAKVTGGGWISIGTGRTSFGFNAIPQAGSLFTGQFQLRSNNGKNRFHGNVVSGLSGSGNTATWTGTGSWNGQPGYTYTISVVDNGSSGSKRGDTISITITSPAGTTVYSTGGAQALKGGNITVH